MQASPVQRDRERRKLLRATIVAAVSATVSVAVDESLSAHSSTYPMYDLPPPTRKLVVERPLPTRSIKLGGGISCDLRRSPSTYPHVVTALWRPWQYLPFNVSSGLSLVAAASVIREGMSSQVVAASSPPGH